MNYTRSIQTMKGVDVGYHGSNIRPINGEGCVGKNGIDKSYTFEMVLKLAHQIDPRPNIIVKAGENAKWYLKRVAKEDIAENVSKQQWRDTSRCTMYIIEWDE